MTDVFGPFAAAVQQLSKRNATSTLVTIFIAYALAALGISATIDGPLRWVIAGTGVTSFVAALAAFGYTVLLKPERLNQEKTVQIGMILDWIQHPDIDDEQRSAAAKMLPVIMQEKTQRRDAIAKRARGDVDD